MKVQENSEIAEIIKKEKNMFAIEMKRIKW